MINEVTAALREQTGAEPAAAALVDALNGETVALLDEGRYGEAERVARIALKRGERVLGRESPQTFMDLDNLALLCEHQGRYGEAEPLQRRAAAAWERVLGAEHPNTLHSVNNLAALHQAQGRYSEAEPLYRRALEARERVLGADHPNTLQIVNNLALFPGPGAATPTRTRSTAGRWRVANGCLARPTRTPSTCI